MVEKERNMMMRGDSSKPEKCQKKKSKHTLTPTRAQLQGTAVYLSKVNLYISTANNVLGNTSGVLIHCQLRIPENHKFRANNNNSPAL